MQSCAYASKQAGITTKSKGVLERDKERTACIIAAYARSAPIYQVRERRDRTRLQASTCSCPTLLLAVRCRVGCSTAFCRSAYRATVQFSERAIVKHLPDGNPHPPPPCIPSTTTARILRPHTATLASLLPLPSPASIRRRRLPDGCFSVTLPLFNQILASGPIRAARSARCTYMLAPRRHRRVSWVC